MPLDISFDDTQRMRGITLNPTKSNGQPTTIDGLATVAVQSGDATANVENDGSITVTSGTPGSSQILVSADADLGSGVVTISDVINVTIVGSLAVNLGLQPGTVEPK